MPVDHRQDYRETAVGLLYAIWRDKPRIRALVEAIAAAAQMSEDLLVSVVADSRLDTCGGYALDRWGSIVDEARAGLADDEYRGVIAAKVLVLTSRGNTDRMIEIVSALFDIDGVSVTHRHAYPAGSIFYVGPVPVDDIPTPEYLARVSRLFRDGKPGGVGANGVWYRVGYFGFDDDPNASGYDVGVFAESF